MTSVEGTHHLSNLRARLVHNSSQRKETWPNREEVYKSVMGWTKKGRGWDPRVLQVFMVCRFFFFCVK